LLILIKHILILKLQKNLIRICINGLTQNLQAALASGQTPDVVQMGWNFLNYAHENFETESIDKIFADAGDPNFIKDTFEPNIARLAQTDTGDQVGVPYSLSLPVLYYNPDIFKAAGLDPNKPPTTWTEVAEYAKQIKEKQVILHSSCKNMLIPGQTRLLLNQMAAPC